MFQFPRFPPPSKTVGHLSPDGVAPFGFLGIAGCQRLPQAFRCVATSFIGCQRQGIHHVLFFDYVMFCVFFMFGMVRAVIPQYRPRSQIRSIHFASQCTTDMHSMGGAAGTRTPDLRRARAALSQLSYGPIGLRQPHLPDVSIGGRAWTRTRDLGLIRAAL